MIKWNVYAKGIEEIVTYIRDDDTLTTKQWWRHATWEVETDDETPPDIQRDINMSQVPYRTYLLDVGEFKGSMDYDCTCELSTDEDGSLNHEELYQPEDFGWIADDYQLWIRTDDISIDQE